MSHTYAVTGRWPFPIDMLRYDDAQAASEADALLIQRLSGEFAPDRDAIRTPTTITLTTERSRFWLGYQSAKRWESFGWKSGEAPEAPPAPPMPQGLTADALVKAIQQQHSGAATVVVMDMSAGCAVGITNVGRAKIAGQAVLVLQLERL